MLLNKFIPLGIILAIVLALVGCTPPTPPPSPTPPPTAASNLAIAVNPTATPSATPANTATPTPEPSPTATRAPLLPTDTPDIVAITVWENLPPAQAQQLAQDIVAFQEQFPRYILTLEHYASPENFMTPLMAGQLNFDVVLASPALLSSLRAAGQIAPMSDFFPPSFLDGFSAVPLSGATAVEQIWGIPETAGFHLMLFYNRAIVDTPPATTAELTTLAETLTTDPDAPAGLAVNSFDPLWVVPWLTPYGGWLIDADGAPALDSPAMVEALTLHQTWLTSIAPATTYEQMVQQFADGDTAMMINGDWAIGELAAMREVDWGVARLPAVSQGDDSPPAAPLVLAKYWAIGRAATQQRAQAAGAFVEYVTRPERQLAWAAKFGTLPTSRTALDDPLIANDGVRRISAAQMQAGRSLPLGVNPNLLLDAMRDPLQQLIAGDLTPEQSAAQMQQNATR